MIYHRICLLCALVMLLSCQQEENSVEAELQAEPYFDLKGLIQEQIILLDSLKPEVELQARIGSKEESKTVQKDSTDWAETLRLYVEADLNKPVLRGQYLVKDSSLATQDARMKIYQAKKGEEVNIPYMKVMYNDQQVSYVEAVFREENVLYNTMREMRLHFENYSGQVRLKEFSTLGRQKMIFRDSVIYRTMGSIRY